MAKVCESVEECTSSALAREGRGPTAEGSGSEEFQLCEGQWSQAMRTALEAAVAEKQVGSFALTITFTCGSPSWPPPPPPQAGEGCDARVCGLSWVDQDSRTAFSKYR